MTILVLFIANTAEVQANVTREYVKYAYNNLAENGSWGSVTETYKKALKSLTEADITNITNYINNYLAEMKIEKIDNNNITFLTAYYSNTGLTVITTISNNTVPHDYNLANLVIHRTSNTDKYGYIGNLNDKFYRIKHDIELNTSNNTIRQAFSKTDYTVSTEKYLYDIENFWAGKRKLQRKSNYILYSKRFM